MSRRLLPTVLFLAAAFLLGARATAQSPANGQLFVRTDGDVVRAVIRIELQGRWHIYHQELGHPKAIGQPTVVTLAGDGVEWGPVRFPEPVRLDQSDAANEPGVFILAHEHELVLRAVGKLAPGASTAGITAKVKGLVCEDVQGCVPYRQTLEPEGAGADSLFADWPADLVAPAAPAAPTDTPAAEPAAASPSPTETEAPEDELIEGEHADATLYTRVEGAQVRAALVIELDPEWHLYHVKEDLGFSPGPDGPTGKPTVVTLGGEGITWEAPRFPTPKRLDQSEFNGPGAYINAHEGTVVVYARGTLAPGAGGAGRKADVVGQLCDPNYCIDYHETAYDRGRGPDDVWSGWEARFSGATAAAQGEGPAPVLAGDEGADAGLLKFLLLAIAGGLFALVMPCTYPMIPITISFFTKQAEKRGKSALSLSLAYGAGIVLIFVVVGVVFGSLIKPFAAHPVVNLLLGAAFVYFALVLFGAIDLQPPRFLMNAAGAASARGGYVGVFLMGATLVVTSFTCTAPFVGSLLSVGATAGGAGRVALGMAVFGLTMAVPFVLLSLVPARLKAIPRSGEWMNTVKVTLGFVELAASLKFFSNTDLVWGWGWLSRDLFLMLWAGIFGVAALYLFGMIHVKSTTGEISPGRLLVGLSFALFSMYCLNGAAGSTMDAIMTAIVPNYSTRPVGGGEAAVRKHAIVMDDYELARARARAENKLLLVNFTGHT